MYVWKLIWTQNIVVTWQEGELSIYGPYLETISPNVNIGDVVIKLIFPTCVCVYLVDIPTHNNIA